MQAQFIAPENDLDGRPDEANFTDSIYAFPLPVLRPKPTLTTVREADQGLETTGIANKSVDTQLCGIVSGSCKCLFFNDTIVTDP